MSLRPQRIEPIPDETIRVARAAFPRANAYMQMRDELGILYQDAAFAALFPRRGQPAASPWRLALVSVLQYAEGLSDRQAADAVRARIDWKYALALELTDPGFDASVLCEFRARLIAGSAEQTLLDALLEHFKTKGLLKARGRQRTDSTAVLAAIRARNRLEGVGETLRHALNALAVAAPDWLRPHLDPTWAERYGPRVDASRLPDGVDARQRLAEQFGADGLALLRAIFAVASPPELRTLPAVVVLRQVWVQQYHAPTPDGRVRWRAAEDLPPAARMIHSPHDPEARYAYKRSTAWTGYKVHLTETCDPEAPHLITHVATTPATTPDRAALPAIHQDLARRELLPREHLVDAGYPDAALLVDSQTQHAVTLIGPVAQDQQWQAQAGGGLDVACFTIDWDQQRATCPQGKRSHLWQTMRDRHGNPVVRICFAPTDCQACPRRADCTTSARGRRLTVRPQEQHQALVAARAFQDTPAFAALYHARAGIEGTISQAVRVADVRHARYRGLAKTRLQHVLTAAALNLIRVARWFAAEPVAHTRHAPFLALFPQAA